MSPKLTDFPMVLSEESSWSQSQQELCFQNGKKVGSCSAHPAQEGWQIQAPKVAQLQ